MHFVDLMCPSLIGIAAATHAHAGASAGAALPCAATPDFVVGERDGKRALIIGDASTNRLRRTSIA
jgi:hypothetical protein